MLQQSRLFAACAEFCDGIDEDAPDSPAAVLGVCEEVIEPGSQPIRLMAGRRSTTRLARRCPRRG